LRFTRLGIYCKKLTKTPHPAGYKPKKTDDCKLARVSTPGVDTKKFVTDTSPHTHLCHYSFFQKCSPLLCKMLSDSSNYSDDNSSLMSSDEEERLKRTDSKSDQIKVLEKLVENGILNKKELPRMIHAILASPETSSQRRHKVERKDKVQQSLIEAKVEATIKKRTHRQRASPQTILIRNCIREPIARRYQVVFVFMCE